MNREELRSLIREVIAEATADMRSEIAAVSETASPSTPTKSMTVAKGLLGERQIQAAASKKLTAIHVSRSVLLTPLAKDAARSKGIRIERID